MQQYIAERACIHCGLVEGSLLEFDHVRGAKVDDISTLVRRGARLSVLAAEIEKCVIRWRKPSPAKNGVGAPLV